MPRRAIAIIAFTGGVVCAAVLFLILRLAGSSEARAPYAREILSWCNFYHQSVDEELRLATTIVPSLQGPSATEDQKVRGARELAAIWTRTIDRTRWYERWLSSRFSG